MSEGMDTALSGVIKMFEETVDFATKVAGSAVDVAQVAAKAPINVGGKTADAILVEVKRLMAEAADLMRALVDVDE